MPDPLYYPVPGAGDYIRAGWRNFFPYGVSAASAAITNHECNAVEFVPGKGFIASHDAQRSACISADGNVWGAVYTTRVLGELPMFRSGPQVYAVDTQISDDQKVVGGTATGYPTFNALKLSVTGLTNAVNCWAASNSEILLLESYGGITRIPIESSDPPAPIGSPSAPQNLVVVAGNQKAALSWAAPAAPGTSAVTSYVVQQTGNFGSTWTQVGTPATTAFTAVNLLNGHPYLFRVAAVNASGTGAWSEASIAITPSPQVPGAPTNVRVSAAGPKIQATLNGVPGSWNTNYALAWAAPTDNGGAPIASYVIERVEDAMTFRTASAATSYTTSLERLRDYQIGYQRAWTFRVAAVNSAGQGAWSSPSASILLR